MTYQTPDLNTPLAEVRESIEQYKASMARHSSDERKGKGIAWDIQLMEDREPMVEKMIEGFTAIDTHMTNSSFINSPAPDAWTIDRLTDEQIAACKADWPELGMFADDTIRRMADVVGIRMVRAMAQEAVRRAPAVLQARNPQ
ncbi:hypothetical protein OG345_42055 (plasmid) [Streptomyces sp. NBC_01220]|uniref:hypothetical protein n=1 Tax=Streptomyces sp. NBC_01220 TaxID=2903781 RepID=UPI00352F0043|nr:hypothetical protein OG345_42055 [Streptomyces sp. NBC_01220]